MPKVAGSSLREGNFSFCENKLVSGGEFRSIE
jgi:hypothetical protein